MVSESLERKRLEVTPGQNFDRGASRGSRGGATRGQHSLTATVLAMQDDSNGGSTSVDCDLRGESMPARAKDVLPMLADTGVLPVCIERSMVGNNQGPLRVTDMQACV